MSVVLRKEHPALAPVTLFMAHAEKAALSYALNGEEGPAIAQILDTLADTIRTMPRTYAGRDDNAIVHLHYFRGGSDWYITELGDDRQQAFGFVILNGDTQNAELGYVSIEELVALGVELDLYWTKITLGELKLAKLQ